MEINLKIIIIKSAHCEISGAQSRANENSGWGVARRLLVKSYKRFGRTRCLRLQDQVRKEEEILDTRNTPRD